MTIFQCPNGYSLARKISIIGTVVASLLSGAPALASSGAELQKLFGGIASWYGGSFHGRRTASGGIYDMNKLTCAHKTLPFGTKLLIFNPHNGRKVEVVVTDRGPYIGKRVIDLSKAAADKLNISGIGHVICFIGKITKHEPTLKELPPITAAYVLHGELATTQRPLEIASQN